MIGLAVDLPYPDIDGIGIDYKSASIILPAYASMHGELNAVLQYQYNTLYYQKEGLANIAKVVQSIAITEMEHLAILGRLLLELGVDPKYAYYSAMGGDYYSASFVTYSKNPRKMIMDSISAEMVAVMNYQEIVDNLENERVSAVVSRIKIDEELHVLKFKELLNVIQKGC